MVIKYSGTNVRYLMSFGNYFHNNFNGGYIRNVTNDIFKDDEFYGYLGCDENGKCVKDGEDIRKKFMDFINEKIKEIDKNIDLEGIKDMMHKHSIKEIELNPIFVEYVEKPNEKIIPTNNIWVFKFFIKIQNVMIEKNILIEEN